MALNNLASEILTISGVLDTSPIAIAVGDVQTLAPIQTFAAPTVALTRKPAGSAATIAGNAFTADVAGRYVTTVSAGGFTRTIDFYAFPSALLNQRVAPANPVSTATVTRSHMQGLLSANLAAVLTNLATTLEAATPTTIGLLGGTLSPQWQRRRGPRKRG